MDLTIQQLRMLQEVATTGTIALAASNLGYTASAVSQQLAGLERAVGVPVLERVGRNVRLTDAGRELVVHARLVLGQVEEASAAIERLSTDVAGTVVVGVMESVAMSMLPSWLRHLRTRFPRLSVRTREYESAEEAVGAAFAGGPVALAYSRFSDEVRIEAERAYLDSIEPYRSGLGYRIPGEYVVVCGVRRR